MPGSGHKRQPGTLPRPLAALAALALVAGTATAVSLLPAKAGPDTPSVRRPAPPGAPAPRATVPARPGGFVGFVDTARRADAALTSGLASEARRTGIRRYAVAHLVTGPTPCSPAWAGNPGTITLKGEHATRGASAVIGAIGRLRAAGGDAGPVFGGPVGRELAATCTAPGALAVAYRKVVRALDAAYVDFEVRDGADRATVLRRARAIRALQRERPLGVTFTLPLRPYGLSAGDVAMLRLTRAAGARVDTVNVLAAVEPQGAPPGRLRRLAMALHNARTQVDRATDGAGWRPVALTPVLANRADLSEADARALASFAARHGLAWLSLRGAAPYATVSRLLHRQAR
jgi:chitinase